MQRSNGEYFPLALFVRRALECDILTLEQVGCSSRSGLAFDSTYSVVECRPMLGFQKIAVVIPRFALA
jgi:hypothetical protein